MTVTITVLFLVLALICFVLAFFGVGKRFNLIAAGLAFTTAAALVGQVHIG